MIYMSDITDKINLSPKWIIGLFLSFIVSLGNYLTIFSLYSFKNSLIVIIVIVVCIIAFSSAGVTSQSKSGEPDLSKSDNTDNRRVDLISIYFSVILYFLGVILFFCIIPSLIIFFISNPTNIKKYLKIIVFLISLCSSAIYYYLNKEVFPTFKDKITFFSSSCIGPVAVIEIFI